MDRMQQLETAFRKAHEAGDADAARMLAAEIRKTRAQPQAKQTQQPAEPPKETPKPQEPKQESAPQANLQPQEPKKESGGFRIGGFSDFVQGAKDLAQGVAGGVENAGYAIANALPDLPISPETRTGWNNNVLVRALGLRAPGREERDAAIAQNKAQADQSVAGTVGNIVGASVPNVAMGVATGGAGLIPSALLQAGTTFLTTPGTDEERLTSAAFSAGGEAAGRLLPQAISRIAQPIRPTPAADRMINWGGIYPTPGQAAGGIFKSLEDYSTSIPGWGHAVGDAQKRLVRQGAGLAMSQGSVIVPGGREGYRQLSQHIDDGFRNATRPLAFDLNDPAFTAGVRNIMQQRGLDVAGVDDINRFLANVRTQQGAPAGGLVTGRDFQSMLETLRREGSAFRRAQDPFQRRLGEAYRDIYNLADNSLSTQGLVSPDDINAFRQIRSDYARVAPALKAGEMNTVVRNQGVFTPEQYQNAVANNAKSMGNTRALREGTLAQQQLADDLVELFGGKPPDSGTATRSVLTGLIPGASMFSSPASAALAIGGMGAGYGIGSALYSDPARRYMLGGYPGQRAIADALRNFAPTSGTLGAAFVPQFQE